MAAPKACFDGPCDPSHLWDGSPQGKETTLAGLSTYVAEPPTGSNDKAVVLIADIYGWKGKNTRLWADKLAAAGFLTVVPDFFRGDAWPAEERTMTEKFQAWRAGQSISAHDKAARDILEALKQVYGAKSTAALGFCWGGLYAALVAGKDAVVAASVMVHASMTTEQVVQDTTVPTLWLCAENDGVLPLEARIKYKEILDAKSFPTGLKVYPGTNHGFAIRGDMSNKLIAEGVADAVDSTIAFFRANI